ncbi:MAG: hypothetical protein DRN18_00795 [Thermoplasmata archaeon]|nr:MAG: hypothetical protein DRN18_00795 [Thermoplasmata archaeon]
MILFYYRSEMMKFYIETYGCTANRSDESIIKGILLSSGFKQVDDPRLADVSIILTCTVIGTTEQRMLNRIKSLYATSKDLIVSGCMASVQADLVKKVAPGAKLLPPDKIDQIIRVLEGKPVEERRISKTSLPRCFDNIRAPISISEGCMFSCSYCITSKARGKLVSYPIEEIVSVVKKAVKNGAKEIQLTSQDLASYGLDKGLKLHELVKRVSSVDGDFMIRLGMMNPLSVKNRLEEIITLYRFDKVYKFLHLPVQSGDDYILKRMNRGYSSEDFKDIVYRFRAEYPEITLSTDIIVGFPGEDDEAFQNTVDLIKEIEPDIVNITRFSPRPFTKAKHMDRKVPTDVAKERSRYLTNLCREISRKRNEMYVGKVCRALVTEKGKGNSIVARTFNYKPVVLNEIVDLGRFVDVEIASAETTHLIGKLI